MNAKVQITFDARDPARLARFWAEALGYVRQPLPPGFDTWQQFAERIGLPPDKWDAYDALVDPDGAGSRLFSSGCQRTRSPRTVSTDVTVGAEALGSEQRRSAVRARSTQLVEAGATVLHEPAGRRRRDLSLRVVA